MAKLENCTHCFSPYLHQAGELPLCKACLPQFQQLIVLLEWLQQANTWPYLKTEYTPQRHDGLYRLALLVEAFHTYAGQYKKHLPYTSASQCYICPKPLPWWGYSQAVCLTCAAELKQLKLKQAAQQAEQSLKGQGLHRFKQNTTLTAAKANKTNCKTTSKTPWREDLKTLEALFKKELLFNERQLQEQLLKSKTNPR